MLAFLELEAKRWGEKKNKLLHPQAVIRALVASYYEKRVAGLLVGVDD
jgi:hypothetical protein